MESNDTLIKMEGVKKVFYTDEVETHALEEIHLEIQKGQYISIAGPSGCGKIHAPFYSGAAGFAHQRALLAQRSARFEADHQRAHSHSQPRNRIHFSGLQLDRGPHSV